MQRTWTRDRGDGVNKMGFWNVKGLGSKDVEF